MWHVSSRSGVATLRTAIHLLLTYLLTYLRCWFSTHSLCILDFFILNHFSRHAFCASASAEYKLFGITAPPGCLLQSTADDDDHDEEEEEEDREIDDCAASR